MNPLKTKKAAVCLFALLLGLAAPLNAQSVLYGTTGGPSNPGNLYTIDPSTGFATLVGPLVDGSANAYAVTGLAFDATGTLYGSTSSNSPTGVSSLITINPLSGLVTLIGIFDTGLIGPGSVPETMADLTFRSANNTLYGGGSLSADLYSIDLGTGQATSPGASGISTPVAGVGLAADNMGIVFGAPKSATGNLYTYNTGTGAAAAGPALTGSPFGVAGSIGALAFNLSGTLYGVDINRADDTTPRASELVTIDTTTGAVIDIGTIKDTGGNIPNFDAIVFAIPEPSTWVAGSFSLGAIVFIRRRRLVAIRAKR